MTQDIQQLVLAALRSAPASGGALIERLRLDVRVYGALANLLAEGEIEVLAEGPGEKIWGVAGADAGLPRDPGLPASFSLSEEDIGRVDARIGAMTSDLPGHYFEELRRAMIARADRDGRLDLDALGGMPSARRLLLRVQRGGRVPLVLRSRRRWVAGLAVVALVAVLLRVFVIGLYTVPPSSISMAPALFPAAEGGDALVLANLLATDPVRGEIWIFRKGDQVFVKRVMGLPGERIEIREGDLFIDGERLVKERALLDRVAVRTAVREGSPEVTAGFPLPEGGYEHHDETVHDVIVSGRVVAAALPAIVTITLRAGDTAGHTLILGLPHGGVAADGIEIAKGTDFALEAGRPLDFWITNADGCLRVEIGGVEVARARVDRRGEQVEVVVERQGDVEIEELSVFRDLIYLPVEGWTEWTVGAGRFFFLGDNSANSYDSRHLKAIPGDWLLGRVWAVAWPPSRVRLLR